MEFYVWVKNVIPQSPKFQFPTGWNSTLRPNLAAVRQRVSIPNGMEFYSFLYSSHSGLSCVSIPNGMEFYLGVMAEVGLSEGFNSQRDGILPYRVASPLPRCEFQFPTGWNSTRFVPVLPQACYRFNSQRDGILRFKGDVARAAAVCFNSQRDGILPRKSARYKQSSSAFQFPTGWNSTILFY